MYDPLETDLSLEELKKLFLEIKESGVNAGLLGGWATHFYVNETYRRAFGREYMGSRDIDLFFESGFDSRMSAIIRKLGFEKNGLPFRYERIYDRERHEFVSSKAAMGRQYFNLVYIFLDMFSDRETTDVGTWWNLEALKRAKVVNVGEIALVDFNTLVALKCTALFARDKADKENKDACDIYALLFYSDNEYEPTLYLKKAIEKLVSRTDLIYAISEHVLLDPSKQNLVLAALQNALKKFDAVPVR